MNLWLLLLFFIAIALGYALGRLDHRRRQKQKLTSLAGDYARGINLLLNEQPDQAVEVLLGSLDVTEDTLETHLSLARVFRRKGEIERATRLHKNLLDADELSDSARDGVLLELALDYLAGGVFDRAEELFNRLVARRGRHASRAMRYLMQIFEQEKDWHNALAIGARLERRDPKVAPVLAHYCCQLAENELAEGAAKAARRTLKRALFYDKRCARAWLLRAQLEAEQGDARAALSAYLSLYGLDGELFDEVLPQVEVAYRQQKGETDWLRFLADACIAQPSTRRVLRLAQGLQEYYGEEEAAKLLADYMQENPSVQGFHRYIDLTLDEVEGPLREHLQLLRRLTQKLPTADSQYQCQQCGFAASQLHWQCPSCKKWGSIRPRPSSQPT